MPSVTLDNAFHFSSQPYCREPPSEGTAVPITDCARKNISSLKIKPELLHL